jgi:hypothetical protein
MSTPALWVVAFRRRIDGLAIGQEFPFFSMMARGRCYESIQRIPHYGKGERRGILVIYRNAGRDERIVESLSLVNVERVGGMLNK